MLDLCINCVKLGLKGYFSSNLKFVQLKMTSSLVPICPDISVQCPALHPACNNKNFQCRSKLLSSATDPANMRLIILVITFSKVLTSPPLHFHPRNFIT